MSKIDIDVDPWLGEDGVSSTLWFNNSGEPAYEETVPYEQLIDRALESYTVNGVIRKVDYEDAEAFVKALEHAATYARTQFERLSDESGSKQS